MIPGINNLSSVGSAPTLRKAFKAQQTSPMPGPNRYQNDLLRASQREISQIAKHTESPTRTKEEKSDAYNPITNPIPWQKQNPYIHHEKSALGVQGPELNKSMRKFGRSILSQNAEMNLI